MPFRSANKARISGALLVCVHANALNCTSAVFSPFSSYPSLPSSAFFKLGSMQSSLENAGGTAAQP